jgi:hypothetical protein
VIDQEALAELPAWLVRLLDQASDDVGLDALTVRPSVQDPDVLLARIAAGAWQVLCLYRFVDPWRHAGLRLRRYRLLVEQGIYGRPVGADLYPVLFAGSPDSGRAVDRRMRQALAVLGVRTIRVPRAPPFLGGTSFTEMLALVAAAGARPPLWLAMAGGDREVRWLATDDHPQADGRYVVASYLPEAPGVLPRVPRTEDAALQRGEIAIAPAAHGRVGLLYRFE